ncbi:MAG: threonine synthase [Candidatus Eremiobacteraeota bacterium]|nr:threonine synthase [Candidatus Eremiobacteraeota bacterium]
MKHIRGYESALSGNFYSYEPGKIKYQCDKTGENLDVVYDYDYIKKHFNKADLKDSRDYSIWRYAPMLPVKTLDHIPPLQIGWTPLYKSRKLGKNIGLDNLYFKDDGRNPSASFKDRASAIALVRAIEDGATIVTGASTGNAGSSMACLCASVGMPAVIFVPEKAPVAKIAQLLIFGAKVFAVRGTYDEAFDLCLKVSGEFGWINRNTGYNPFTREGKKTCAFEICEQLEWEVPDRVFVSVGDGNIISGLWKGFRDLFKLGFIDKIPKLYGVQSEKSNSIFLSVKECKLDPDADIRICTVKATTIADSISVDTPRDGQMAVRAILETDGDAVQVSDEDILDAVKLLGKNEGIFAEPAGATAYAGVRKLALMGDLPEDETIVAVITGNGLKDVSSALKVAGKPIGINPDLDEVKRYIN